MAYSAVKERARVLLATANIRRLMAVGFGMSFVAIGTLAFLLRFGAGESVLHTIPFLHTAHPSTARPSVTLRQGTYIGVEEVTDRQTLEQFLGIPYALSTEGENRFKPPVPVEPSAESYNASKYGDVCPAGNPNAHGQSEDCLSVNIYRPKSRPKDKKLPVLIHIYGGSFNFGAGFGRNVGNMVAWSAEPFIGVSFNYRIGALGFLSSKIAQEEGLLNAGLKDQVLLLEWVQQNIEHFGGDAGDVTLMGQSAGAHSVGHHVFRNDDKRPLFHKAIIESGGSTARACYTPTNAIHEQQFSEFLAILGCDKFPKDQLLKKLQAYSVQDIKQASEAIFDKYNPSIRWPWQPVIDGEGGIIPVRPMDAWKAAKWHKIPILTGFNTNEGSSFVPWTVATSKEFTDFFHILLPSLSQDDLEILDQVYPDPLKDNSSQYVDTRIGQGLGAEFKRLEQAYAHFAYIAPVRQAAYHAATSGDQPVYLYHFAVNSSIIKGAGHGTNPGFPTYDRGIRTESPTLDEIAGSMHAYWTSFITTGDPNTVKGRFKKRPEWPVYKPLSGKLIVFGKDNDERAGGVVKGTAVSIADDTWAAGESEYWWARTEKFEI
jgi:acetylcholinesterase